jgi:hypothetical protein
MAKVSEPLNPWIPKHQHNRPHWTIFKSSYEYFWHSDDIFKAKDLLLWTMLDAQSLVILIATLQTFLFCHREPPTRNHVFITSTYTKVTAISISLFPLRLSTNVTIVATKMMQCMHYTFDLVWSKLCIVDSCEWFYNHWVATREGTMEHLLQGLLVNTAHWFHCQINLDIVWSYHTIQVLSGVVSLDEELRALKS